MQPDFQHEAEKKMSALEAWMAPLFKKAPHIPSGGREVLAQIAPWFAIIFGILGLLALLSAGMLASLLSFTLLMGAASIATLVALIAGIGASILQIMAFGPLQSRKKRGWNLIFYGTVLTTISSIVNMFISYGSIGSIIGALIGFWLLFEVRPLYR